MNKSLLVLGSVLVLTACSGGGSSGNGNGVKALGGPVDPAQRPPNPASKAYIKELYKFVAKSRAVVPSEEALFAKTFYGEYDSEVTEESRLKAVERLNDMGRRYLDRIKAVCTITPLSKAASADTKNAKEGDVIIVKLNQSVSGKGCELLLNQSADVKTQYLAKNSDVESGKNVEHTVSEVVASETQEIRNNEIIQAAGVKSFENTSKSTSDTEYISERVGDGKDYQYKSVSKYIRSSVGTSNSVLANGGVITSTSESYSSFIYETVGSEPTTRTSESSSLSKISSPGGAIWVGYQRTGDNESVFYLNGEVMSEQERKELFGGDDL